MDMNSPLAGNRKGSGKDEAFRNLIRYGTVSSVNPDIVASRVNFKDKGNMVSHWLPQIVPGSLKNKHFYLPSVDEDVVCLFLPNGIQRGFVLGSYYNVNNPPPVTSASKDHVTYSDGTVIEYDSDTHTLTANVQGTANITATTININGAGGDVVVSGISLKNHVHGGVQSGGSDTSGPIG
jgi:phage baseplate assembly protein V